MMKKSGLIRFKKISIKTSMIVGFLIPVIVFAVVSIIITAYQTRLHQDEALKQQGAALTQIAYNINNSIENFTNSIHVLESNVLFNEFVSNSSSDFQFSPYKTANIINSFSHIKFTNNLFYELIIYNRKSDTVLTSNSIYKASDFFDTFNEFEKYPYSYWKDYTSPTQIQILGSSKIASFDNYHTSYLPVVFSNVLRNNTDCIIIGCIQKQTLDDLFSSLSKIPQADIYMLDSDTNFVFNWKLTDYINIDSSLKEKLLNTYEPQNTKINRDNYICISLNSQFPYFKDCTLLTAIPSSALNEYSKNTWLLSLCLITLAFMTACMIIIRNTKSFYSPIKEILNSAENVPLSGNEFDALKNIYSSFKNTQKNLYENISELLPIVCEQKTMQFITKSSSVDADDLLEYLKKNNIDLSLNYFCIFVLKYSFTEKYMNTFNIQQNMLITYELERLLSMTLPQDINSYTLHHKKDYLCVISNFDRYDSFNALKKSLEEYIYSLSFDKELLRVYIGISETGDSFNDLQALFTHADECVDSAQMSAVSNLYCFSSEKQKSEYEYSSSTERLIYNSLMSNDYKTAAASKQEILDTNSMLNISTVAKRALLYRLYLIATDVLRAKKLKEDDCVGTGEYINFASVYNHYDISELSYYIDKLYKASTILSVKNSKIDKQKVIDYINEHYNEDLYLDMIAEEFDTSSKYISRLIKEILGVSFQQYLSNIRIEKSKALLLNTSLSVKEIAVAVGFNNQNTFLRAFDKIEGTTPTTFRKSHK